MMAYFLLAIFAIGYIGIALEHTLQVNKAGTALVTGILLWICYVLLMPDMVEVQAAESFASYLLSHPSVAELPKVEQYISFITNVQIIEVLGEISETLFFLISAMTIVEIIDVYGGFKMMTNRIKVKRKASLMWVLSILAFFMSAVLDNMTTTIVMIVLLNRLIADHNERWVYSSIIVIAANSGGAWSPIGDITTIMLWVKGNITSGSIIPHLIIPCIVSSLVPTYIAARKLKGEITYKEAAPTGADDTVVNHKERMSLTLIGVLCLISVPIFKVLTHLPPFMGALMALGMMWIYTEWMYRRKTDIDESLKVRMPAILRRIDISTILFFLGILLSVSVLQHVNILNEASKFLDHQVHNVYAINMVVGILSSIIDNVPIVAAAMSMYPLADTASIALSADAAYLSNFVQDGLFWEFLAYCAGTGGSMLIIGSAAGVVAMGIDHIPFSWYFKRITLLAFAGYLAGAATYILQAWIMA